MSEDIFKELREALKEQGEAMIRWSTLLEKMDRYSLEYTMAMVINSSTAIEEIKTWLGFLCEFDEDVSQENIWEVFPKSAWVLEHLKEIQSGKSSKKENRNRH